MFLLLALLIQSRLQQNVIKTEKQIAINSNVNTVIDTFEGVVLNERIEFDKDFQFPNPCILKQQPVRFTSINPQIQKFQESYINGTLIQEMPKYITIAQVGLGVMVLTNRGDLNFYIVQENLVLRSSHKYPELSNVQSAIIELIHEKLIILTDSDLWLLEPNFSDEDIFNQKDLKQLEISHNQIHKSHQVDDYLYILSEETGINVFKFENDKLILILQLNQSIQDFQVIKMDSYHYVLYLEKDIGLQFCLFNLTTNKLDKISEINLLYNVIQGDGLSIYKNRLLVFNNNFTQSQKSCISLFIFDIQQSILNKIGTQHISGPILSVQSYEDYILIFGSNIHYTMIWSIFYNPKLSNTNFINQYILPGLNQQILKINDRKKNVLLGITNNTLIAFEIEQQKAFLECLVNQLYPKSFSFNYYVKTTNCKELQNISLGICQINNTYNLNVLYSNKQQSQTILYLTIFGLILNLLLIITFIQQYWQYRKMKYSQHGFDEFEYDSQKSSTVRQKKSSIPDFEKEKELHAPKASRTPDPITPIIIVSDNSSN